MQPAVNNAKRFIPMEPPDIWMELTNIPTHYADLSQAFHSRAERRRDGETERRKGGKTTGLADRVYKMSDLVLSLTLLKRDHYPNTQHPRRNEAPGVS